MLEQQTFTFPFKDEDWVGKFLVGSLLYLISPMLLFVPLIVPQGYALRVWREAIAGLPPRLPEWDEWAEMGIHGLIYYVITTLYSLPLLIAWLAVFVVGFGGVVLLAWAADSVERGDASALGPGVAVLFLVVGVGLAAILALVASLLIGLWLPMAVSRYLETGRLGAAFEFGAVWRAMKANLEGLLVAWLVLLAIGTGLGVIVGQLGAIPCCGPVLVYLLMMPFSFYLSLVQARLMGRVHHEALRRLAGAPSVAVEALPVDQAPAVPELVEEIQDELLEEPAAGGPDEVLASAVDVQVPIETLGLSARLQRILHDAGLDTVGQVLERLAEGEAALLSVRGLGPRSLEEIKDQLAAHGFVA